MSSSAPPMTEPTTIPAIWPPDKPLWFVVGLVPLPAPAPAVLEVGAPVLEDVDEGKSDGIVDVEIGSVTPEQRVVTFDPRQHESVAFGELVAQ